MFQENFYFYLKRAEASLEGVKSLNPHVKVQACQTPLKEIDYQQYDIVSISGIDLPLLPEINEKAHNAGTRVFICDSHGNSNLLMVTYHQDISVTYLKI